MNTNFIQIREVFQLSDPVVPRVIELYQTAFPVREQMFASFFWRIFEAGSSCHLLVAEQDTQFLGFAVWESNGSDSPAYLWYIAVHPESRGQGTGGILYKQVIDAAKELGAPAIMFEVELPEEVREHDGEQGEITARKRIQWYRHLGSRALNGVRYACSTDWNPPMLMLPMIHPLVPEITPQQAYQWGVDILADGDVSHFQQTGELSFDG